MGLIDTHPDTYLPRTHGALECIDHSLAAAVNGSLWTATYQVTNSAATAASVLVTTPATGDYTLNIDVETSAATQWFFSETPSATTTGGSTVTGICNNRTDDNTDPLTLTSLPTYATAGTVLEQHQSATIVGGKGEVKNVWTLAQSTTYIVRAAPPSGATTIINLFYHGE